MSLTIGKINEIMAEERVAWAKMKDEAKPICEWHDPNVLRFRGAETAMHRLLSDFVMADSDSGAEAVWRERLRVAVIGILSADEDDYHGIAAAMRRLRDAAIGYRLISDGSGLKGVEDD